MEIGEAIAVTVSTPDKDEPCWACEKPKDDPNPNDLDEDPSSIGLAENDLKNDSSQLGRNLGFRPTWTVKVPDLEHGERIMRTVDVVPGAHHLIPGNASLKRVTAILKFVEKSRGKIREDIGYDVNCQGNGIWLAANYGVNQDSPFAKKWSQYGFQDEYALAAMRASRSQFHDAHPIYSNNVQVALRKLAEKLELKAPENCGICGKKVSDKSRPPYGLVGIACSLAGPSTSGQFRAATSHPPGQL
jgi:hypothetical protein